MKIKNILFDLGGVVLNLDQEKTIRAFKKLGADLDQINHENTIFQDFETGKTDEHFFIHTLHTHLKGEANQEQITQAWNAMLLDLPAARLDYIRDLKKHYRLFLLSNTNTIHIRAIYNEYGQEIFEELFEKIYLSHEIGLRKPSVECYRYVLNDTGINADETVFIDDSKLNLRGAEEAGLHTIWAKEPVDIWLGTALQSIQNS